MGAWGSSDFRAVTVAAQRNRRPALRSDRQWLSSSLAAKRSRAFRRILQTPSEGRKFLKSRSKIRVLFYTAQVVGLSDLRFFEPCESLEKSGAPM